MPELYRDKFPGWLGAMGVPIMKLEERLSAWCADAVLAVHEPHRQRLADYGIPADKIKVVLNSPDDRIFVPSAPVKDPDTFNIVCHGTITHRMGMDLAVRAVARLRDRIPKLRLMALGAGDYVGEIRRLVAELKLEDRVIFKDMIPIEELPKVLCTADLGLVANRQSSATHLMLPVKLLEFAMLGIPALAPRLKTVEYYFGDDAVRFFKPEDVGDLANAIEQLYAAPELRRSYAENARKVIDQIGWRNQRGEFYRAIDSVLPRRESATKSVSLEKRKASLQA